MAAYSNKVVDFDGTNEYVSMGNVLGFERTSPQSYSVWMKLNASSVRMLLSKSDGATTYRGVSLYTSNGTLVFMLSSDASSGNRIQVWPTGVVYNDNNWHHVVVSYDGSSTAAGCKIYIDSVLQTLTVAYDALTATILNSSSFILGSRSSLDAFFSGRLDEVAVYNRVLTATEAAWIYNGGLPRDLYTSGAPSGLLAWWRMGEGDLASSLILLDSGPSAVPNMVRDISGNSYHGTMTNMESSDVVYDAPGAPQSVVFSGTNEYVTMGNVLGFERTNSFSISLWARWTDASLMILAGKVTGTPTFQGYQIWCYSDGTLHFQLINTVVTLNLIDRRTTGAFNDGRWHHIAMTYDGSSSVSGLLVRVDDVAVPTIADYDNLTATILTTESFILGSRVTNDYPFVGSLDEVAVYDKALSPAEVTWIYNNGVPRSLSDGGAPSNLAAWWRMGDGDTYPTLRDSVWANPYPTIYDASGKGHDGTMTNMSSGDIVVTTPGGVSTYACNFAGGVAKTVRVATFPTWYYNTPFSVSFWVKTSNSSASGVWRRYGDGSNYITVQFDGTKQITFILAFTGVVLTLITDYYPLRDGNWHHVVVSYNGSATGTGQAIFVDGNLAPNWGYDSDTLTSGSIATRLEFVNYDLNGLMDEGAVYSKALSLADVQWLYNSGAPRMLNASGAPTDLAGWWRMGEDGFGKSGTMQNMEATDFVGDSPGHWGFDKKSLLFDGVNEYVTMGNILSYERTQAFSVSFWVKYTGAGSVITRLNAATVGWMVDVVANGVEFGLISSFPGSCIYGGIYRAGMNDGRWHHCVVSYNGSSLGSGVLGYFDGGAAVPLSPGYYDTLTSSTLNTAEVWVGGRYTSGGPNHLAGGVDEVAVYNRVLTVTEAQWIYNAGVPNNLKDIAAPSNLVAYWRMGENAFPGTMTNMEAGDILSESPAGLDGSLYDFFFLYGSETAGSVRDGNAYLLGGGGGSTVITHYKLRVRDDGAGPPAVYREWESTDYNSTPPPPSPIGSWVERTVLAMWTV